MVGKLLRSRIRTAGRIYLLLLALRQIPLKTQHGKCKAQFAMFKAPVAISTRPAALRRQAQNWVLHPQMITVNEAPVMAASRILSQLRDSLNQCRTGLVQVLGLWELLANSWPPVSSAIPTRLLLLCIVSKTFTDALPASISFVLKVIAIGVFLGRSAFFRFNKVGWSLFSFRDEMISRVYLDDRLIASPDGLRLF